IPALQGFYLPIARSWWIIAPFVPYVMIAFIAMLVWIAWQERSHVMAEPQMVSVQNESPQLPVKILLTIALGLSIATIVTVEQFSMLTITVQAATVLLPTLVMYFLLLSAGLLLFTRRTVTSAVLFGLALLPFGHWAYVHWAIAKEHAR